MRSSKVLLLSIALVFTGCYKKETKLEESTSQVAQEQAKPAAKPNASAAKVPVESPPATASTVDVNLYLEISNGMKGFIPPPAPDKPPTAFQTRLNQLISEIQDGRYVKSKRFYLAKENNQGKPVLDSVSYSTLKNTISSGIKADVRGTPLPDMLQAALAKSMERKAVSIIISDFIHGPDPRNPGQFLSLDSDIRSSLKAAEQHNQVVAVLGATSPFYGTYHPAVKKPAVSRVLQGEEIPYYIWIVGPQQEVQVVMNKILRNLPAQQAYFGFQYPNVPFSAVLKASQFKPMGLVYCTNRTAQACTSVNLRPEPKEPVQFTIGLDLSQLPASMKDAGYLKQYLKLTTTGAKASLGTVIAATDETRAVPELSQFTHFVKVNVPALTASTGTLTLTLPQVSPAWVGNWSTENDNNPAAAPKKTYQFSKIIQGVQALYRDQNENVLSVTMKFNKENN
ncbi:hypothetical protein [Rufibacter soli]